MALFSKYLGPGGTALVAMALAAIMYFASVLWRVRKPMRRVRRLGKPMPQWSPVFGHLLVAGEIFNSLQVECHSGYMLRKLLDQFPNNGAFYFDVWPMMEPMLVVTDAELANHVVTHHQSGFRKPETLKDWFNPITGGPSLFDTNGQPWKVLHNLFSPAFSNTNTVAYTPVVVDRIRTFCDILRDNARRGEVFLLEPLVLNLVTDIIGEILLNIRLDSQRQHHPLSDTMIQQLKLKFTEYKPQNFFASINPFLRYRLWNNGRILDQQIRSQLELRFRVLRTAKRGVADPTARPGDIPRFKSVIDLAIEEYLARSGETPTTLDEDFMAMATRNMRMFFFAGYDSTASTALFCYYNLWRHPAALARLRAEHDSVFGPLSSSTSPADAILANPHILNSLPYTHAVIKETLRLFPPANGVRQGCPDLELCDARGTRYPTDGFTVLISHYCIQRDPRRWSRPDDFVPERWLNGGDVASDTLDTDSGCLKSQDCQRPPRGGWRPFEHGPRLCIGQQLVMSEIKAVLACTVREFDIRDAYDEIGAGAASRDLSGVGGQAAFMIEAGAAHPNGQYPCRVTFSGYGS
ncbi:hypothetical protein VTK73DRAFT_9672 [Phialemonium thermophilum]|uniref:Cytochrome P450 n=1 Tax=Phialemonium thermophilum TaxID=223376 RepID=A0ABR3XJ24_9PEZI